MKAYPPKFRNLRKSVVIFLVLLVAPIMLSAAKYLLGDRSVNWQLADRSSAGLLPPPNQQADAVVRVFAARTVRWRGIFAVHSWIVVKDKGAQTYTRYDYTAWGEPIRINGFAADGRWFGGVPETIAAADGEAAERMIPENPCRGRSLPAQGLWRLPRLAGTELQHLRDRRHGGGAGAAGHAAADRHRQGLSL